MSGYMSHLKNRNKKRISTSGTGSYGQYLTKNKRSAPTGTVQRELSNGVTVPTTGNVQESTATAANSGAGSIPKNWVEYFAMQEQALAEEKKQAYDSAKSAEELAIRDARASYELNKPTYGAQAEALRTEGQTGSGYGEYLAGRNYATYRGEVANAGNVRAAAKASADAGYTKALANAKYQTYLGQKEEDASTKAAEDSKYNTLLSNIQSGVYKDEAALRSAATAMGLEDESKLPQLVSYLGTVSAENAANKKNAVLADIVAGSYQTPGQLEIAMEIAGITDPVQKEELYTAYDRIQRESGGYSDYNYMLETSFSEDLLGQIKGDGTLNAEQKAELETQYYAKYADATVKGYITGVETGAASISDFSEVKAELLALRSAGQLDEADYQNAINEMKSVIKVDGGAGVRSGEERIIEWNESKLKVGTNGLGFGATFKIGEEWCTLGLVPASEKDKQNLNSMMLEKAVNGTVAVTPNNIYFYSDGKWYKGFYGGVNPMMTSRVKKVIELFNAAYQQKQNTAGASSYGDYLKSGG